MRKIEEILHTAGNKPRYDMIKTGLEANKLVVFFGAGLSLGGVIARQWRGPFDQVCINILYPYLTSFEEFINSKREEFHDNPQLLEQLQEGQNQAAEIRLLLENAKRQYLDGYYYKAGDLLSAALESIKSTYCRWGIVTQLGETEGKSINDIFADIFKDNDYLEINKEYVSPYSIPTLFYLPYVGNRIITTNIEPSFEKVTERLQTVEWWKVCLRENQKSTEWFRSTLPLSAGEIITGATFS